MLRLLVVSALIGSILPAAQAFEEPAVNLGASSFFDGTARGSGWYVNQYFQYYTSDRFNGPKGESIPVPTPAGPATPHLDAYTSLTQVIYLMKWPDVLGAHLGFDGLIPVTKLSLAPGNSLLRANGGLLGDLTIGPALQFDPIRIKGNPVFQQRIDLDVIVPTGDYDPQFALNPGANAVSFNPYWAASVFLGPHLGVSWRLHYLWNDINTRPNVPAAHSLQAGQAVHMNFDAAYEIIDGWLHAGVNGYYLKQLADTKIDGAARPDSKEQVLGIGPGIMVSFGDNTHLFLNGYFETAVENRSAGARVNAVFAHHF